MEHTNTQTHVHRDDEASKIGMWMFIFTELLLFGGLFIVYSVYRFRNQEAFAMAARELNLTIGIVNTVILMASAAFIGMATVAMRQGKKKLTLALIWASILLGIVFLVNKYFEWDLKIAHGLFPGSEHLHELGHGDTLFFGLYFFMTGLHALHLLIGLAFMGFMLAFVGKGKINSGNQVQLDNCSLYWHLVDLIWIFLFPLFYLIA
ncbi:MAG: cytochrome c oxidase subunit 3 family protein [Bacteroidales bacterium]